MAGRCRGGFLTLRAAESFVFQRRSLRSLRSAATAAAPEPPPVPLAAAAKPASSPEVATAFSGSGVADGQQAAAAWSVDFSDAREAFRSKSSAELARGLLVLRLCSLGPFVDRADQVSSSCAAGHPGAEPTGCVEAGGSWANSPVREYIVFYVDLQFS